MLFYNLFLLMLFTFQLVGALPLLARGQQFDDQPCPHSDSQPGPLEGPLEDNIDKKLDPQLDYQIDSQPDEPPPGLRDQPSTTQPSQLPTDLSFLLPPSQPTIVQPPEATVTSIQPYNSPIGAVTKTCIITLIPIEDNVLEVENCTLSTTPPTVSNSVTAGSSNSSTNVSLPSSTYVSKVTSSSSVQMSSSAITTSSSAVSAYYSSSVQAVSTSSTDVAAPSTSSSSIPPSTSSIPASTSSVPTSTSSVPTSPSPVLSSTSFVPSSVSSSVGINFKQGGTSSARAAAASILATSTSSIAGTVAAADATGDKTVPGRKLSVLPIGLGVFAGISVIALVVVGLVTYERTKYRKAFRKRKLAESGAAIGYGGNSF